MKILFVCTGNTCRSPMAMCFARKKGYDAMSAGVHVYNEDTPASLQARSVVQKRGMTLVEHRSHQIDTNSIDWCDKIVCMTEDIRIHVLRNHNVTAQKVHIFSPPIPDPYGLGEAEYERVARLIENQIDGLYYETGHCDPLTDSCSDT